ncbi:response regulator transcription factor [Paraburkholderia sp. PREW-6R]|uniref:response regulator transcription factor n=1 Tax=Paraburkholderia sp. PREW-6R TaxID=3141544 RepID=UPI0031F59E58
MSLRIILADDHPFVLLGIRAILERVSGVTVVGEADTPRSLIELLRCTPCDVLVTDLAMPDASADVDDGPSLVRRVRQDWPQLRIVVLTALTNSATLAALLAESEVSALGKTEPLLELGDAIGTINSGARYIGPSIRAMLEHPATYELQSAPARPLSGRQSEVVRRVISGQSIPEIADALGCHRSTVTREKRKAMARLGVTNDPGLFSYVRGHWIIDS